MSDPNQRLHGAGFSVLPPAGDPWFVVIYPDSDAIVFAKKDPLHIQQRGSVIVVAARVRANNNDISTAEGLLSEIERNAVRTHSARFTLVSVKLEPQRDTAMSTDCVLINTAIEERDNPNRPGETLLMTVSGKACRNPLSPTVYVQVTASERRPVGSPPLVDDKLRRECERAINSVEFLPPR